MKAVPAVWVGDEEMTGAGNVPPFGPRQRVVCGRIARPVTASGYAGS